MSKVIPLTPIAAEDGEIFNIGEDASDPKGQLRRFLKILGPVFDETKGLVDAMPNMRDVDTTDIDFLKHIAALLATDYDSSVSASQTRQDIKQAVQWYKRKGTVPGCEIHGYKNTRFQTDVVEFLKNVRTANRAHCFSADLTDGVTFLQLGLPGDPTAFSFDYSVRDSLVIGKESASSYAVGYEPLKAIDDKEGTRWLASAGAPGWWAYDFTDPFLPAVFRIKANLGLKDFTLQWSENGSSWTDGQDFRFGDVQVFTENLGVATGSAQTLGTQAAPVSVSPVPVAVYESDAYGTGNTTLRIDAQQGTRTVTVNNSGGFSVGEFVELIEGDQSEVHLISKIEGNLFTFTAAVREESFGAGALVKNLVVYVKTETTDFTVDPLSGAITLVSGSFTAGSRVLTSYEALSSRASVDIWQSFYVNVDVLVEKRYWRFLVTSTWYGNPEIIEVAMCPGTQFYYRFYRSNRIGYFLRLDDSRPLTKEALDKLRGSLEQALPVYTVGLVIAVDLPRVEIVSGSGNVLESWDDVIT